MLLRWCSGMFFTCMDEQLRRICRISGIRISFGTTNTRDSFFRTSVDFVLNLCTQSELRYRCSYFFVIHIQNHQLMCGYIYIFWIHIPEILVTLEKEFQCCRSHNYIYIFWILIPQILVTLEKEFQCCRSHDCCWDRWGWSSNIHCWPCWEHWTWKPSCCENCLCSRSCTDTVKFSTGLGNVNIFFPCKYLNC